MSDRHYASDVWLGIGIGLNLLSREHVRRFELDARKLLLIRVPKATRAQRPVYLDGSWERKTFLRVHDGDRIADRDVARRMLADAQPDRDAHVLEGYRESDLHADSIKRYRQLFTQRRPDQPFVAEDDRAFLRRIGAVGRDRARDIDGLTLGGLLMLGM